MYINFYALYKQIQLTEQTPSFSKPIHCPKSPIFMHLAPSAVATTSHVIFVLGNSDLFSNQETTAWQQPTLTLLIIRAPRN